MRTYTLQHLSDAVLLRDLAALVAQDRLTTATLLAHIAEVDARRLYAPAGYPSMHAYCMEELRLSEDAAFMRIRAARAARQFPALFEALAEGRLHLTAVCLIAPYLTTKNVDELIEAASHRKKFEIEQLLASRFPVPDMRAIVRAVAAPPAELERESDEGVGGGMCQLVSVSAGECDSQLVPERVVKEITRSGAMVTASAERYLLQVAVGRSTHEKLRHAQALLSHAVPDGDVAQVLDRALDVLIAQLEKRKFAVDAKFGAGAKVGAGSEMKPQGRPNGSSRPPAGTRYVPAHIRSAVWERDQGQCTFVSASGHRCGARRFLEFDHVDPVARGGGATVERMRLRCRAHNQYEAERAFGAGFMEEKRRTARRAAAEAAARTADMEATRDLLAGLRSLGCRGQEARRAAEHALGLDGASLEQRMRAALKFLGQESIQGRGRVSAGLIHGSG